MSRRLQVILDDIEWRDIGEVARRHGLSVSEWVRRVLREARRREPEGDVGKKLDVIRAASKNSFPTADIDQMLDEIERGYR